MTLDQMISADIAEKIDFFLMTCRTDGLSPFTPPPVPPSVFKLILGENPR
jgi:hypothetical protein